MALQPAPVDPAILHRIRTGDGQCPATNAVLIEGNSMVTDDQCLDATEHDGDHQGLFGTWPREGTR